VQYKDQKPSVIADHLNITLTVRPGSEVTKRAEVMHAWQREQMHCAVPALIRRWEPRLKVKVDGYFLQRMKTKWGSCNSRTQHIRLNTELVKKPKDLLEYVIVHEMLHISEPRHSERFFELIERHYPRWREAQAELNELPLGAERWKT
jgi:predicted metal-dependent hydrolase